MYVTLTLPLAEFMKLGPGSFIQTKQPQTGTCQKMMAVCRRLAACLRVDAIQRRESCRWPAREHPADCLATIAVGVASPAQNRCRQVFPIDGIRARAALDAGLAVSASL